MTPSLPSHLRAPRRRGPESGTLPGWAGGLGVLLVLVLSIGAIEIIPEGSDIAVFWPAAGVGVAVLALSPRRYAWWLLAGVFVATMLSSVWAERPLPVVLVFALAATLGTALTAALITGGGKRLPRLRVMDDLLTLLLAAAAGATVQGVLLGLAVGAFMTDPVLSVAPTVAAASMASYLLILPLALLAADRRMRDQRFRGGEAALQLGLMLGVLALSTFPAEQLPTAFATLPFLVWAALRLPAVVVAGETLLIGLVTTLLTVNGLGTFGSVVESGRGGPQVIAALLQVFLATLVVVALALALSTQQRREATAAAEEGRELYRRAMDESVIGMMLLRPTPDGLVVADVNGPAEQLLGASAESLEGRLWTRRIGPDERFLLDEVAAELELGRSGTLTREVRLEGEPATWVRLSLSWREHGTTGGLVTVQLVDISEMKLSRVELRSERDFTGAVLNSTDALILVLDHDQVVSRVNQTVESLLGGRRATVVGQPLWNTGLTPQCVARLREVLDQPGWELEQRHVLGDHEWRTSKSSRHVFSWTCSPLAYGDRELGVVLTGIDVTAQRAAQDLLERVLDATTGTAIIGTDAQGTITFFNPGAEQMLGYVADEVVENRALAEFHDLDELTERAAELGVLSPLQALLHDGGDTGGGPRDWTQVRKDGERITVSMTVSEMASGEGEGGYVSVAQDVTERRRVESALHRALAHERQAVERLHELDQEKTAFVASVSHELRTPMTSVLGFCQLLLSGKSGELTDRQHTLLTRVSRNARRLLSLIEDLLTVSRFDSEGVDIESEDLDVHEVLAAAVEAIDDVRRGREVELRLPEEAVAWRVHADRGQIERVAINLLSNAVKFTPDGGSVTVGVEATGDDGVALIVEDTGVGVPEQERDRIFERFYRASTAQRAALPGTGLGLNIVRSIVEAHGGTITVESTPGAGSRFVVVLPRGGPPALRVVGSPA